MQKRAQEAAGRRERLRDKLARAMPKNAFFAVRFSTRQTGLGARTSTQKKVTPKRWNHSARSMLSHRVFRNTATRKPSRSRSHSLETSQTLMVVFLVGSDPEILVSVATTATVHARELKTDRRKSDREWPKISCAAGTRSQLFLAG
jgi:hypothetical protein